MHGYALIKGFQYRISPGEKIKVPFLDNKEGEIVDIFPILMYDDGTGTRLGEACKDLIARATIVEQGKGKKVCVFKKKRRNDYRVKRNHRQKFTTILINEITKTGGN
jgi:large subunit ribosomal protein L21